MGLLVFFTTNLAGVQDVIVYTPFTDEDLESQRGQEWSKWGDQEEEMTRSPDPRLLPRRLPTALWVSGFLCG